MEMIIHKPTTKPIQAFKQILGLEDEAQLDKSDILSDLKFEKDIEKFKKQDNVSPPPQNSIVFVGSSSIRRWKTLEYDFPKHSVIRRGFGGSHMCDALYFVNDLVTPYKPKAVAVYEGDNDLNKNKSPDIILAQYKQFCRLVHEQYPLCPILFISVKASTKRWGIRDTIVEFNSLVSDWSNENERLEFVDVFYPMLDGNGEPDPKLLVEDGLHLTPRGYQIWTEAVSRKLDMLL